MSEKIIPVSKWRNKTVLQKSAATCFLFFFLSTGAFAQSIGIGTTSPHSSAVLDMQSSTQGVAFPSMTSAQRKAIANPKTGLLVFDTDKSTLFLYDGSQWLALLFTVSSSQVPPIVRGASDGGSGDEFGSSVSISGNYAAVGAPFDNNGVNTNQGSVYIFQKTNGVWTEQAKLIASDGAAFDHFGWSVSISSSYVLIGSYLDDSPLADAGSAYVFSRSGNTWTQQAKLTASNAAANKHFGYSVSLDNTYAVIGAKDDDIGSNTDEGSAYFFHRIGSSWVQEDNVVAPFGAAGDNFGNSVCINGDYVVIGAYLDDVGTETDAGTAHVYIRNGTNWEYQDLLVMTAPNSNMHFGESVAIDGSYAVVGVPPNIGYTGGLAVVFMRSGSAWTMQTPFLFAPSVGGVENRFGTSVSINGDRILVGAPKAKINDNIDQGAAYLFERDNTTWVMIQRITDSGGFPGHQMGNSVAISGYTCLMGANAADALKGRILFLNVE